MKISFPIVTLALVSHIIASPISVVSNVDRGIGRFESASVDDGFSKRQSTSLTANEFTNGGCKEVVLIFARGTAQLGNLVCCSCRVVRCYVLVLNLCRGKLLGSSYTTKSSLLLGHQMLPFKVSTTMRWRMVPFQMV